MLAFFRASFTSAIVFLMLMTIGILTHALKPWSIALMIVWSIGMGIGWFVCRDQKQ
jgi:L-asparagine transporter-like permease